MTTQETTLIHIENQPSKERLEALGVANWQIWTKEVSEFPWTYGDRETCYLLAGEVTVTPENGEPVSFGEGDLVVFPAGMSCTWKISRAVKKHYRFG